METVSLAAISRVELEEFVHKEDRVQWVQTSVDVHVMYYPAALTRHDVTSVTGLMLNTTIQTASQPACGGQDIPAIRVHSYPGHCIVLSAFSRQTLNIVCSLMTTVVTEHNQDG